MGALRDTLHEFPQSSCGFAAPWVGEDSSYGSVSMDAFKSVQSKTYR